MRVTFDVITCNRMIKLKIASKRSELHCNWVRWLIWKLEHFEFLLNFSIVLLQLQINFFPFFSSQRNKKKFLSWRERPLLQGVCLFLCSRERKRWWRRRKRERRKRKRKRRKWPWPPHHFEFLLKVLKWNQLSFIQFVNVIAVGKFYHNCK